jgi:acetyl esterase/lipase
MSPSQVIGISLPFFARLVAFAWLGIMAGNYIPASWAQHPEAGKLLFSDDFESGQDFESVQGRWETTDDSSWALLEAGGNHSFAQTRRVSNYQPKVRSPHNIALIRDFEVDDFVLTFRVRSTNDTGDHRDCCVFFGHQDAEHFYYVHLGARPDPASGQIMIVNNEPRRPLTDNKNLVPWDDQWHNVKLVRNSKDGTIAIYFDDMTKPVMSTVDRAFAKGRVGIGSFDDMNEFDDVQVFALAIPNEQQSTAPTRPLPTIADFPYGNDSPRQKFDFWQAKSDTPTPLVVLIHGGGWVNGDKSSYGNRPINQYLSAGISVAAINYRFIREAMDQQVQPPVKACLEDAALAIQTLRSKASEWNIDPHRVAASGGSAGACTSLWLALHDDLADPNSEDLVARQSTRLQYVAVTGAQTSLDPVQLREWIANAVYAGHAFGFAAPGRKRPEEFEQLLANVDTVKHWFPEYSPYELVTGDDPPLFLEYPNQKTPPQLGGTEPDPTHSAVYGIKFSEKCQSKGVECHLVYPGYSNSSSPNMVQFLIERLGNQQEQ